VRWFNRGNLAAGVRTGSVDVPLAGLVDAVLGRVPAASVPVDRPRFHELGEVAGVGLAVTDAIALPDGRMLLGAAAEDSPNAVDDGPVVASALVLVDGDAVLDVSRMPEVDGRVAKVEGLALRAVRDGAAHLLAVVDDDDPSRPSTALELRVALG
jgi:hypothetical protein